MKELYFYHLASSYLKTFFVIFFSLTFFFVGIDYLQNNQLLANSANIHILYIFYDFFNFLNYTVYTSLVFAFISRMIFMVNTRELVALYSFGYSKRVLLSPFLWVSTIVIAITYLINLTDLAYAKEKAFRLTQKAVASTAREDLFLKYNDTYVYMQKLIPSQNIAYDVKVYEMKDLKLQRIIEAKNMLFDGEKWLLQDAIITIKPPLLELGKQGLIEKKVDIYPTLNGFKPKFIESLYEDNSIVFSLSIIDAVSSLWLLNGQTIDTSKIRLVLYTLLVVPFFAPLLIVVVFRYTPISSRVSNIGYFGSIFIFVTLVVWGLMFAMSKLAFGDFLTPEIAIVVPMVVLVSISYYNYRKI